MTVKFVYIGIDNHVGFLFKCVYDKTFCTGKKIHFTVLPTCIYVQASFVTVTDMSTAKH